MSEVNGNFFCLGCKEEVKIKYGRQKNEIKYGPIVEWKSINNEWSFLDVSGVWGNYKYIERWNDYKFWYCCECGTREASFTKFIRDYPNIINLK